MLSTRRPPQTSGPSDGSRTITIRDSQPEEEAGSGSEEGRRGEDVERRPRGVLKLRGGPRSRPQVQWTDDVVDNEGAGRKKSKICCIYHKPRAFDESSSESSSGSDSESDASSCRGHNHGPERHNQHGARAKRDVPIGGGGGEGEDNGDGESRGPPNAYEKGKDKAK